MHVPPRFACNSRDAIRASGSTMTIIDLAFPLQPAEVPRDHGYPLGAADRAPLMSGTPFKLAYTGKAG